MLATVLDRKTGVKVGEAPTLYDHWSADLASVSDYYPGGFMMPGRNLEWDWSRMGLQLQPKDDEIYGKGNVYTFKYRMEDARINRFFSVDPLHGKYPHNSDYAFSENRLTDVRELEGLEIGLPLLGVMDLVEPRIGLLSENEVMLRPAIAEEPVAPIPTPRPSFPQSVLERFARGRKIEGEQLEKMGLEKNTKPSKVDIDGKEVETIPDAYQKGPNGGQRTVEIKNVRYQSKTKQLKAQEKISNGNGERPLLRINKDVQKISRPVQESFDIQYYQAPPVSPTDNLRNESISPEKIQNAGKKHGEII